MKKNILIAVFTFFLALIILAGGFLLGINFSEAKDYLVDFIKPAASATRQDPESEGSGNSGSLAIKSIEQTIKYVLANAINKKTEKELADAAIEGILASLKDRYADYFPSEEYSKIIESYSGTMSGIGVIVTANEEGQVLIINVIEGTPAFEQGLAEGDIIAAVDGTEIMDMALDQVVALIKGPEGTDVIITVFRPSDNKKLDFTITRRRFYVPNFYSTVLEDNILYIQYVDFQENGAKKLEEKLREIMGKNSSGAVKGIIIDLRNNLGGTLDDAVQFCDLFLDSGIIVSVRGRSDNSDKYEEFKASRGGYTELPMAVLINGYSASAAELAAGALKDLGRAALIGEKSFGKGTVQILNELPDGSGIKYTTAKYYLPSGITIDGTGIQPDIEIILTPEDTEDTQFNRAVEEIKKMIGK